MQDQAYENREIALAIARVNEIERAPLADRKAAAACFMLAMADNPEIVGERIGWLIGGCYGYGEMILARRVLANKRMNREAALAAMIGVYEWTCPGAMFRRAWRALTVKQRAALSRHVAAAIRDAETALQEG